MAYGTLKVDTITFTNGGADQNITVSGLVASTSGNLTATGTISGSVIQGGTLVSGATVTGAAGQFTNLTSISGVFTTQVSGATITGNVGQFTSLTGISAGFTTVTGTTVTGTTANFVTVSGTTVTGTTANFVTLSGTTVTGTTASFTSGVFTNVSGGVYTITSGVLAAGSATNPSLSFNGDANTGIYSPGSESIAFTTNGQARLVLDSDGQLEAASIGSASTPIYSFGSDPNTGMYSPGADQLAFSTNGTGRLFIDSSGNVGIGTTAPTQLLQVHNSAGSDAYLRISNSDTGTSSGFLCGLDGNENGLVDSAYTGSSLILKTQSNERARIDSSGRLGLGTSSPQAQLHVAGDVFTPVNSYYSSNLYFDGANWKYAGNGYGGALKLADNSGYVSFVLGSVNNTSGADATATVYERMVITTSGNVGIGTTSPDEKCHIQDSTASGTIKLGRDYYGLIQQSANDLSIVSNGDQAYRVGLGTNDGTGNILFKTANGATGNTTRMAITAAGNVGIGATNPGAALEVAGDILVSPNTGSFRTIGATDSSDTTLLLQGGAASGTGGNIELSRDGNNVYDGATHIFRNVLATSEFARIDSSGRLGLGTSSPGEALDVKGAVRNSIGTGTGLGGAGYALYQFGTSATATENWHIGAEGDGSFRFYNQDIGAGLERVRITSAGNVGIGTTGPVGRLDVATVGDSSIVIANETTYTDGIKRGRITKKTDNSLVIQGCDSASPVDTVFLRTVSAESARIDSSGRLLVGTSSARANFFNSAIAAAIQSEGSGLGADGRFLSVTNNHTSGTQDGGGVLILSRSGGTSNGSNTIVADANRLGQISFSGSDGSEFVEGARIDALVDGTPGANDMPGRLVFSTTADASATPTERLRITSAGVLQIADAGDIAVGVTTGTKIGTATSQKIGFYNATPVVQPAAVADATDAATVITQLNDLLAKLRTLGLIAT